MLIKWVSRTLLKKDCEACSNEKESHNQLLRLALSCRRKYDELFSEFPIEEGMATCGPNPALPLFIKIKFYWNTATPNHFAYCLWLLSYYNGKVVTEAMWPTKPKIFTLWPFPGKICQLLKYKNKPIKSALGRPHEQTINYQHQISTNT